MRFLGLCLFYFLISSNLYSAESDHFVFESSGYKFETVVSDKTVEVTWHKSGFVNRHTSNMKPCWKKSIKREIASVGKKLLSPRGKHQFGRPIAVSWNKTKDSRYVFPREMDQLDKHFGFIFGMAKSSEGKCGP